MNEPAIKKALDYQAYFMHDEKLCYIMIVPDDISNASPKLEN
ncbi:hypothetical protein [Megamonas hypermegale]|nr:hypothetical protein [Megamonas hypermegale]